MNYIPTQNITILSLIPHIIHLMFIFTCREADSVSKRKSTNVNILSVSLNNT